MAHIRIPDENRTLTNDDEIRGLLAACGITYQRWAPETALSPGAADEEVLAAYRDKINEFRMHGPYVRADVVGVSPTTPGLEEMMEKFAREHMHAEDEVRFIVEGHGLLHVHPAADTILAVELEAADLISVPAGMQHWFTLCSDRNVRAVRLFQNPEGWVPHYSTSGLDERYEPVCFGPHYIPTADTGVSQS